MDRKELINTLWTDNPRTEIVPEEPFADYLAAPAVSRSTLLEFDPDFGGCPYRFLLAMLYPDLMGRDSAAMEMGSAIHTYYLEREHFHERYPVLDEDKKNLLFREAQNEGSKAKGFSKQLKTYQAWKEECEARGQVILDEAVIAKFERMHKLFIDNPATGPVLAAPHRKEVSIYSGYRGPGGKWDKAIQCKARIDILPDDDAAEEGYDLKKARHAAPLKFARQVADLRLDIQAAWYCMVATNAGRKTTSFTFLAQEDEFPYMPAAHDMPDEWVKWGLYHSQTLLQDLKTCFETNQFPDYGRNVLIPPDWLAKQMESIG